ncbi:5-(carboxyamino)imidazole ribonucleotide mutase [Thermococcus sp. M39]|uniref:5-(carboxyamino)imidazole ribonucleotide mutase n=1 Tax=unclassified Thermococcus TaxID=2627626 RepID=UPI001439F492|nr:MULTISPECIES: 5-(carboxyamino)imidazole ribonucleotide mutase [unclassified Thermococcus]NJE08933.1 5-(carboxyamino)imidazole ribonucleotide mutase [Thermococcus sp. M39]NJE12793.1 5-(carboxyamino)imidazole ribonucleotide mutase [Thermococcus sp. LS2]
MKVLVVMGSKSDSHIAEKVTQVLDEFGISYDVEVASAHRNPKKVEELAKKDYDVFIAIAGLSAALPGAIASHTTKPVIGVPVSAKLGGLDSLLSIAQMPPGVPVATVGIDNGKNAALLAIEILALKDESLKRKLEEYRERMRS